MIIESVEIRRFGKLTDFKASFHHGFNLIEGMAESGKTTLSAFLSYMLYGFPAEKTAGLSERTHYIAWEGGEAAGSMCFRTGDARYRIERTSIETERGWRDTYALVNLDTGLPEQGEASPGERFLGVGYDSFRDTAFLSDLLRGAPNAHATADAIENILFSGEERLSTEHACRVLSEARAQILSEDGRSGAVTVLEKERNRLKEQLAEATAAEQLHFAREEELYITRKKMEEARGEIDKFTALETNYYNAMLIKDYDSLHELENTFDTRVSVIRAHEERYRAAGFLPDREYLNTLTEASVEARVARRDKLEAESAMAQVPAEDTLITPDETALLDAVARAEGEEVLRAKAARSRKRVTALLSSAITLVALAILCLVLFFRALATGSGAPLFGTLSLICLGATVLLSVESVRAIRVKLAVYAVCNAKRRDDFYLGLQRAAEAALRLSQAKAESERAQMRLVRATERLAAANARVEATLGRWGVSLSQRIGSEDTDEQSEQEEREALLRDITAQLSAESREEFCADLAARVTEGMAALADTLPAEDEDENDRVVRYTRRRAEKYLAMHGALTAMHRDAEARVRELRKKLDGQNEVAVRARVAPEDRERYRNQNVDDLHNGVLRYRERLQALMQTERELTDALAKEIKNESLAATAERILALDGRIALLTEQAGLLARALSAVKEGEARLRREISPRLSLDACRFLYEMTDGKYSELLLGKDFSLTFDEGDGAREVAYLSHSTEDLTYYALRLALVNLMYREAPPLCFDGCTARQDDERALCFLRAVRTLTEEGKQCFFFASGSREKRLAEDVFSSYGRIKMPG